MSDFDTLYDEYLTTELSDETFVYKNPVTGEVSEGIGQPPLQWGKYPQGIVENTDEAYNYDIFRSNYLPLPHEVYSKENLDEIKATEEGSQLTDPNWMVASKIVHSYLNRPRTVNVRGNVRTVESENNNLETGTDYAEWGVNFMSAFDYNLAALAIDASRLNNAPDNVLKSMYYLMETADRDGMTLSNFGKGLYNVATDPFNLVGLGTLGIGVAGKYAGAKLTKMSLKELLKNAVLSKPTKVSAVVGAEGAMFSAADNLARQNIKVGAKEQEDINVGELGTAATAGAVIGERLGTAFPNIVEGGRRLLVGAGKEADQYLANTPDTGTTLNVGSDVTRPIAEGLSTIGKALDTEATSDIISARLPTAVNSTEDGINNNLQIGSSDILDDKKTLNQNITVIKDYPNLRNDQINGTDEEIAETYIEHLKDNLLFLYNKVPEKTKQRSKLWYDGANKVVNELAQQYNLPPNSVAGVFASLSPQKDWFMNADLGKRVIDILSTKQDFSFDNKMLDIATKGYVKNGKKIPGIFSKPQFAEMLNYIKTKKLSELESTAEQAMWLRIYDEAYNDPSYKTLTPEGEFTEFVKNDDGSNSGIAWNSNSMIESAIKSFYSGGDSKVISPLMGSRHKVRSFYNNIINPNSDDGSVTIDTHAVASATLRPVSGQSTIVHHNFGTSPEIKKRKADWKGAVTNSSVTGVKGLYGLYAEAYRRASSEVGILPREMQSITWEAVRGLYPATFKQGKGNIEKIDNLWYQYRNGKLTLDEVRDGIFKQANGINPPAWE